MSISGAQALWDYYKAAAVKLGRKKLSKEEDGAEQGYSVRWYFEDHSPKRNILTRAFLGEEDALALVRRAILGKASAAELDELYDGRDSAPYSEDDFLEGSPAPDEAQREAIRVALAMPISFIKGPPGTGKSSTILHLMSCILRQNKTAAMVSSNNMAIRAITDKLDTYAHGAEPKQSALYQHFARLGNGACRAEFEQAHPELFPDTYKSCADMPSERFQRNWPIIASTINSLPRCFADWKKNANGTDCPAGQRREPVYDYVIVDESSQVNAMMGLMAMGGARHLVLVGDDDQLPPVTDEERIQRGTQEQAKRAKDSLSDKFENVYALREGRSFLQTCRKVFLGGDDALEEQCARMLDRHYRCHEGIIGFCQQEVYSGGKTPLKICTRKDDHSAATPIRVVWFEGEFCEDVKRSEKDDRGKKDGQGVKKERSSKCNRRQSVIFMQEEWPDLLDRLCADPCSVLDLDREGYRPFQFCVLSPFRGQLWDLHDRLSRWMDDNKQQIRDKADAHRQELLAVLGDVGVEAYLAQESHKGLAEQVRQAADSPAEAIVEQCIHDLPDRLRPFIQGEDGHGGLMDVQLPELTVHKAQGQEYDVVYFLPVEDTMWEWPWSQKKRLINVAVSRAKRELRIIVSSALMDENIQKALAGERAVVPLQAPAEDCDPEDDAFLRKLIDYVWANGPKGPGPWTDGPFGFHRARNHSLFDQTAVVARRRSRGRGKREPHPSAPEICLQNYLSSMPLVFDNKLSLYIDVPIASITPAPALPEDLADRDELEEYIANGAHFDCVICKNDDQGERILMVIEVDGKYHRTCLDNQINDAKKNTIVGQGFGAAMFTSAEGGYVPMEESAPMAGSGFTFLRLPTDGSAWNEERTIERLLRERLHAAAGPYAIHVRALTGLPADWRSCVFGTLSWKQNWDTGRSARGQQPGVDVRWVPRAFIKCKTQEPDIRQPLMMAYLPDDGEYWKKEKRLRPGMVCRAEAWEELDALVERRKEAAAQRSASDGSSSGRSSSENR